MSDAEGDDLDDDALVRAHSQKVVDSRETPRETGIDDAAAHGGDESRGRFVFFARGLTALDGILEDGPPGSAPGRAATIRRFLRYVLPAAVLGAALALLWFLYGSG